MANQQQYAFATIAVNGSTLAEEASVTVDRDSKAVPVETVPKGFAGISPGAAMLSIEVENAVPAADFELNPDQFMTDTGVPQLVEVTVFVGNSRVLTSKGYIVKDNFSHAVNSSAKLKFSFIGGFAPYK